MVAIISGVEVKNYIQNKDSWEKSKQRNEKKEVEYYILQKRGGIWAQKALRQTVHPIIYFFVHKWNQKFLNLTNTFNVFMSVLLSWQLGALREMNKESMVPFNEEIRSWPQLLLNGTLQMLSE